MAEADAEMLLLPGLQPADDLAHDDHLLLLGGVEGHTFVENCVVNVAKPAPVYAISLIGNDNSGESKGHNHKISNCTTIINLCLCFVFGFFRTYL